MPATEYVIYGSVPWDTPWLTEQNLAAALGTRHRVLYVEPPLTPLTPLRYGPRQGALTGLRDIAHRRHRCVGQVNVFRPLAVPPRTHPRARAISAPLIRVQVSRVSRALGLNRPVVIAARTAPELNDSERSLLVGLVKDRLGAGGHLLGRPGVVLAAEQRSLCLQSDLVCATSTELCRALAAEGIQSFFLRHAFHAELAPHYEASMPKDYAALPRPLVGYTGRIDARLDFVALEAVARRIGQGSVVLVGPVSPRLEASALAGLRAMPNVHFLGGRGREALPAYIRHLDCAMLPYRDDEFLRHASPLKLWDYFYAGPPIVGSGCLSLLEHAPALLRFVHVSNSFGIAVEDAVKEGRGRAQERRAAALANTWEHRARDLHALVQKHPSLRAAA